MTSATLICQNVKFPAKKTFKYWTEIVLLAYFWAGTRKSYYTMVFYIKNVHPKIKTLKFETKIALIEYFGIEFEKTNVVFEISILEFGNMQSFIHKLAPSNL